MVVAVLLLAGCGGSSKSARPTVSVSASASPSGSLLSDDGPTASAAPGDLTAAGDVAAAYYAALHKKDAVTAYTMLCANAMTQTESQFSDSVQADIQAGTGITSWKGEGTPTVQGDEAAVPGTLVLDDGGNFQLSLLLVRESGTFKVCSSNLGGILPGTDTGGGSSPSASVGTI